MRNVADDRGMVMRSQRLERRGLAREATVVPCLLPEHRLERDLGVVLAIARAEDHAGCAGTDGLDELEALVDHVALVRRERALLRYRDATQPLDHAIRELLLGAPILGGAVVAHGSVPKSSRASSRNSSSEAVSWRNESSTMRRKSRRAAAR